MAVKRAIYLCNVHLRELIHTPILYAYLCLFFVYYHHLNAQIVLLQQETGIRVNAFGYTVGVFSNYQSTIVFGLGAVMIFSDLPLIRNNALFESTRCTRNVWVGGRILYIICVSIIYTLVMTSLCLLTCHGKFEDPFAWGKLLNTFASGFSLGNYSIPIELSFAVTGAFNPLQAFGIVIVMCIMCSIFIGLFVLVLSLCFGKMIALLSASVLAVMDFLIVLKLPFLVVSLIAAILYTVKHHLQLRYAVLSHNRRRHCNIVCG